MIFRNAAKTSFYSFCLISHLFGDKQEASGSCDTHALRDRGFGPIILQTYAIDGGDYMNGTEVDAKCVLKRGSHISQWSQVSALVLLLPETT